VIGVVSLRTVPCRVTSQHERKSSSRLVWYASNALRPSSIKVSKVGLRILLLSRSDPLRPESPPFMLDVLEVIDSPAESSKMCCHTNQTETRSPFSKLQKSDGLVCQTELSSFVGTNGSQGHHQTSMMCSSSDQAASGRWRGTNHVNFEGCGGS
jgi:hypothetical protein